jgi:hypothetical protein
VCIQTPEAPSPRRPTGVEPLSLADADGAEVALGARRPVEDPPRPASPAPAAPTLAASDRSAHASSPGIPPPAPVIAAPALAGAGAPSVAADASAAFERSQAFALHPRVQESVDRGESGRGAEPPSARGLPRSAADLQRRVRAGTVADRETSPSLSRRGRPTHMAGPPTVGRDGKVAALSRLETFVKVATDPKREGDVTTLGARVNFVGRPENASFLRTAKGEASVACFEPFRSAARGGVDDNALTQFTSLCRETFALSSEVEKAFFLSKLSVMRGARSAVMPDVNLFTSNARSYNRLVKASVAFNDAQLIGKLIRNTAP